MGDPQPDRIGGYPAGKIDYLFRKTLNQSDINSTLGLVKGAVPFLDEKPKDMLESMIQGLELILYTPECNHSVTLKRYNCAVYKLHALGWKKVALKNGFEPGMEIDCWAVTSHDHNNLSLLIQEVVEEEEDDGEENEE